MKYIIILLILVFSFKANAQEVQKDGKTYDVKKEKIFLDGKEVTETLSLEDKSAILTQAGLITEKLKMQEKAEKGVKKAQKAQKKAEKDQKRTEKALKKKQKAQDRFDRANNKLESAQKKYDRLKRKGKLSPEDEIKWLEKLKKLREDIARAKKKL